MIPKLLIIANWKMNPPTLREAEKLFFDVWSEVRKIKKAEVVICPPFLWLESIRKRYNKALILGAQDVFWETSGAYTGEISPPMLKNAGVKCVIIGHSERRGVLGESDEMVNKKVKAAVKSGLTAVLAVGEELKESQEVVPPVIASQIHKGLAGVTKSQIENIVIAYEPVWAIGTGQADTPDNATRRAIYVRKILVKIVGRARAEKMRIIYGGSVTAKNAASFISRDIRGMDGLLVGGASLKAEEFVAIVRAVSNNGRM